MSWPNATYLCIIHGAGCSNTKNCVEHSTCLPTQKFKKFQFKFFFCCQNVINYAPASISHTKDASPIRRYYEVLAVELSIFKSKSSTLYPTIFDNPMYWGTAVTAFRYFAQTQKVLTRIRRYIRVKLKKVNYYSYSKIKNNKSRYRLP